MFFFLVLGACEKKTSDIASSDLDTVLFTTFTTDVHTLISDSGITRYNLRAKYWYTYDQPEKKWAFPEGIYLEQFDENFTIEASVEADTAYYYQDKRLWELKNNVRVMNRNGQHFFAKTLYWAEAKAEVYSPDPVTIERSGGEYLYAKFGFKSNQTMTKYELYSSSGHMDVKEGPVVTNPAPGDSTVTVPKTSMPVSADSAVTAHRAPVSLPPATQARSPRR